MRGELEAVQVASGTPVTWVVPTHSGLVFTSKTHVQSRRQASCRQEALEVRVT